MRALGFLLLVILFSSWAFLPLSVSAANVTTTTGVKIQNAYGKLTVVGIQFTDWFAVYSNGTVFFQVSGSFQVQQSYQFTAQSYGNGTLTVRFAGPQPPKVTTGGHLAAYGSGKQDILYSVGDAGYGLTGILVVSYQEPFTLFRNAAFLMALMTPIVITIGFARWAQDPLDPNRIDKMRKLYYATLIMTLATAVLFLMSLLFK